MKKILFCLLFLIFYSSCFAQTDKSEFEIIKSIFNTEKTQYIEAQMELNENEEKVFWPIYEDYEIERAKFSRKKLEALKRYAAKYSSLSSSEAKEYTNDLLRYEKKKLKLQNKYFGLMSNKLSSQKASKFIQLEDYIEVRVRYAVLKDLPFVQE